MLTNPTKWVTTLRHGTNHPEPFAFFANELLSAPGLFSRIGFLNIFEINAETMQYCEENCQSLIEEFGLLTFAEFNQIMPKLAEEFFHAKGQYFLISMCRDQVAWHDVEYLIKIF
ncbi:MAG: hypothetical protein FWC11_05130 [Firmicutes bacterium]|nr:hypothetical protein [Bacillota bacterium]